LDQRDARERLDHTVPVPNRRVGSHHPLTIRCRDVNRSALERPTPLDADAIEMWVRHRDPMKSTARPHRRDPLLIDEPEAVPHEVPAPCLYHQRPLTDPNLRIGANPGKPRLQVAHLDPSPLAPQLAKRRPLLARRWHILPLVRADGAY